MLLSEFIERTGYQPDAAEYVEIEKAYYHFHGDKDMFCRAWKRANPHKAGTYFAQIKEARRRDKMQERLFDFIVKNRKRYAKEYGYDYRYNWTIDFEPTRDKLMSYTRAKDINDLREAWKRFFTAHAVHQNFSTESWELFWFIDKHLFLI